MRLQSSNCAGKIAVFQTCQNSQVFINRFDQLAAIH